MTERIYEKDGALLKPKEKIIRCKDCRHADKMIFDVSRPCKRILGSIWVKDNDFCPYGKRKESDNE